MHWTDAFRKNLDKIINEFNGAIISGNSDSVPGRKGYGSAGTKSSHGWHTAAITMVIAVLILSGCSGRERTVSQADNSSAAEGIDSAEGRNTDSRDDAAGTSSNETGADEIYEGTIKAPEADSDESPYYGIMHATVIDINGKIGDSATIYTFTDKLDPDNSWSFSGLEIGDIEAEPTVGMEVAILFTGNITGDTDSVRFAVILPEGDFTLKRIEGKTVNNVMSQFTVMSASGTEVTLIKDNCRMDDNALSSESGDTVIVYYADGGELGNYPVRVFTGK